MDRQRKLPRFLVVFFVVLSLVISLVGVFPGYTPVTHAANNGLAATPFMGWGSWSLTGGHVTGYGTSWMNAADMEAQSDAMHQKLQSHGYSYINLDAFWYQRSGSDFAVDSFGRFIPDSQRFPDIAAVATHVHNNGQKFGLYFVPGIPHLAVSQNTPIQGTSCHANDIVVQPLTDGNHFKNTYKIDYSKPCAQAYINSLASQIHTWGADFLKLDGVAPGQAVAGFDTRADVQAWSQALNPFQIWLELSSSVDIHNISTWQQFSNGWRITGDIECYSSCPGSLTNWGKVSGRFSAAPPWASFAGPGGWNDFDSVDVGNGTMDGISNDERQSYVTLWAISAAPLYTGDDITKLDSFGLSLLTNDEVIGVDQAGKVATPVSQATSQQVWRVKNADGSFTVALFNLGTSTATVTANWSDLGFSGSATVHDTWSHSDLGSFTGSFSALLPTHGSRLLKVTPGNITPTPTSTPIPTSTPTLTPTPTPNPGTTSYEAESSANTLAGGAKVGSCSACSGGQKVRFVGKGGTLQFNNVSKSAAGSYTLTIYYVDGDAGRAANMSINGGTATSITFHGTNDGNWNFVQSLTVTVNLNAGNNTILFSNPSAFAPDFDRITV